MNFFDYVKEFYSEDIKNVKNGLNILNRKAKYWG